ncbi:hypothetical protein HMPREF9455_03721 [Dysgonomonas gadei ATCC BAA-286]|jgi:hypothetical protein|uniref:Uncharacterized protein n=1 Tax=Dysgonomonas gadei ATCC BAA-286 TaxID=742766 RepID=F5J304_9BACT|nr:hypothetical protein HMPREF9455_03721 [Dysgonomonas gadei ATCC BAA-286]
MPVLVLNSIFYFLELAGTLQNRNYNRHNSHLPEVLTLFCTFRIRKNIDKHLLALSPLFCDHSLDKLLLIVTLFPL